MKTIDRFFERLATFRGKFKVTSTLEIRDCIGRCPIIAVVDGGPKDNCNFDKFAREAELDFLDACDVANASDTPSPLDENHVRSIRSRLLSTLGLEEVA